MKVLLGIIALHLLVIIRAQKTSRYQVPYISVFFISLVLVVYIVWMMFTIESPQP